MTHVEFLEKLREQYLKNLELAEKAGDKEIIAFYQGMVYAYNLAITRLMKGEVK